jgi:hypothetical protein
MVASTGGTYDYEVDTEAWLQAAATLERARHVKAVAAAKARANAKQLSLGGANWFAPSAWCEKKYNNIYISSAHTHDYALCVSVQRGVVALKKQLCPHRVFIFCRVLLLLLLLLLLLRLLLQGFPWNASWSEPPRQCAP